MLILKLMEILLKYIENLNHIVNTIMIKLSHMIKKKLNLNMVLIGINWIQILKKELKKEIKLTTNRIYF